MKKKTKQKLIDLLTLVTDDWNWKKMDRPQGNSSGGSCIVYEDDVVKIDKRWKEEAHKILDEINTKKSEKKMITKEQALEVLRESARQISDDEWNAECGWLFNMINNGIKDLEEEK